jgi:NTE family protein
MNSITKAKALTTAGGNGSGMPSFAIAFGGGGARGLAHIHVIEALDELGVKPTAIAGSSIGAIMGAAMAAGMSGREIREHSEFVLGDRKELAARLWRSRGRAFGEAFSTNFTIGQFNIERILSAFLPDVMPRTFAELKIPLVVTGTDYYGHFETAFNEGDLLSALAASAAVPALFKPVKREGRVYIDGGIYNPLPFDLLTGSADIIVAIDVVGVPEGDPNRIPKPVDSMFGATQLMMQSITAMKIKAKAPDIFLRPPVSSFRMFDFLKISRIMRETSAVKDEVKRAVDAAIAFWNTKNTALKTVQKSQSAVEALPVEKAD